jgi:hypothetical protein
MKGIGRTGRACPPRRGFVLVTMMLSLVALLAFLGLAIDVGYQQWVKTAMQTAADAAALGGTQELRASGSSNLVSSAKADAAANGFTDGRNSVSITVNNPPATGYSTSDTSAVEVLISQSVPTFFMQMLGFYSGMVQVRAVARVGGGTNCFYVLNPTMASALSVSGGVTVQFACGVQVNSTSNTALTVTGGSHVTAPYIAVAGKYTVNGGSTMSPAPAQGASPLSDPMASLPRPTVGNCDYTSVSIGNGNTTTLNPGTYCKGISLAGGSTVTFNPGTYVIKGGGLTISNGSHVTGNGVTFYNSYAAGYTYAPFTFNGGTTVTLTAPTTGSYAGILLFQDPTVVSALRNTFSNGTTSTLTGTLYFPTTGLDYSGGATAAYTIIVADNVTFSGGTTVNSNYSSLPGGSPVKGNTILSE